MESMQENFPPVPAPIRVTVEAPINIAFIKYWGKREGGEKLILPTNDSFSITLSTKPFRSKTSVELRRDATEDELWLNGKKSNIQETPRIQSVLSCIRANCPSHLKSLKAYIVSENNFPTAAGMASSASGYCALASALVKAYSATVDVSMLSRLGSGSACRSAYGGFVIWHRGEKPDGTDCIATQFVDEKYWPDMQVLCAVLKGEKKDVSSTTGMQQSLKTSPMMSDRIASVVPARMKAVKEAIQQRDFNKFAEIAMADSDDLQEICHTTAPCIQYATEDSYAMIRLIRAFNTKKGYNAMAYTFDAGANCFMFTLKKNLPEVVAMLCAHFPTSWEQMFFHDAALLEECKAYKLPTSFEGLINYPKRSLEMLLQSPVGQGVIHLDDAESLISPHT
ncbi:putative Mevalonate 5-diphosphate decarboxylase C-terminal domain containing protein [Leishmania shawi]|uniref:Diphosphomevalonate decarboxylase n=1 Tax=Leishmania shawi TaxID=5680 RepID=A0AAW3C030_9TRYP